MPDVHLHAIDLAKRGFQVCGADRDGVNKRGRADIRKLLVVGAVSRARRIVRKGILPAS